MATRLYVFGTFMTEMVIAYIAKKESGAIN